MSNSDMLSSLVGDRSAPQADETFIYEDEQHAVKNLLQCSILPWCDVYKYNVSRIAFHVKSMA